MHAGRNYIIAVGMLGILRLPPPPSQPTSGFSEPEELAVLSGWADSSNRHVPVLRSYWIPYIVLSSRATPIILYLIVHVRLGHEMPLRSMNNFSMGIESIVYQSPVHQLMRLIV
jgi:hypothetical protein